MRASLVSAPQDIRERLWKTKPADRLGRRSVFALGALGTAVFLPVIVLFQSPDNILWMLVVFGFLYGIPYGVIPALFIRDKQFDPQKQ